MCVLLQSDQVVHVYSQSHDSKFSKKFQGQNELVAGRIFVIDIGRLIDFWYFIADTTQKSESQINLKNNTDLKHISV